MRPNLAAVALQRQGQQQPVKKRVRSPPLREELWSMPVPKKVADKLVENYTAWKLKDLCKLKLALRAERGSTGEDFMQLGAAVRRGVVDALNSFMKGEDAEFTVEERHVQVSMRPCTAPGGAVQVAYYCSLSTIADQTGYEHSLPPSG